VIEPDADLACYAILQLQCVPDPDPVHLLALSRRLREVYRYAEAHEAAESCLETALHSRAVEELALGCAHRGLWRCAARYYARSADLRFEQVYALVQVGRLKEAESLLVELEPQAQSYWRARIMLCDERWTDGLRLLVDGAADEDELADVRWAVEPKPLGDDEDPPGPCSSLVLGRQLVAGKTHAFRGWMLQAEALADLGRAREAWSCYYRHTSPLGLDANRYKLAQAANIHERLGHFSKAAALGEQMTDGLVPAAGHWLRSGHPEAAERCCRRALEVDSTVYRDEALGLLGSALRCQQRYAEAAQCFEDAVGIDPDKDEAFQLAIQDMRLCDKARSR
jgi:tetratricopeptide (TPR) repeat protein